MWWHLSAREEENQSGHNVRWLEGAGVCTLTASSEGVEVSTVKSNIFKHRLPTSNSRPFITVSPLLEDQHVWRGGGGNCAAFGYT